MMKQTLIVKNILKKENGDQKFFTWVFNRALELCSYHYLDAVKAKDQFEEKLLSFDINTYNSYLDDFSHYLDHKDSDKDNQKFCLLFFDAISLIQTTYKYCFKNNESSDSNSLEKLLGITKPKNQLDIYSVLELLASLERTASSYNAGLHTEYWVNKHKKNIKKKHAQGGQTKAENQRNIERPIRERAIAMYIRPHPDLNRKWKNRAEFVTYFLNIENPKRNVDDLISDATVKRWIKEHLNSNATTSMTKLLAE